MTWRWLGARPHRPPIPMRGHINGLSCLLAHLVKSPSIPQVPGPGSAPLRVRPAWGERPELPPQIPGPGSALLRAWPAWGERPEPPHWPAPHLHSSLQSRADTDALRAASPSELRCWGGPPPPALLHQALSLLKCAFEYKSLLNVQVCSCFGRLHGVWFIVT